MSRYAQEHPDRPEYPMDDVLDREAARAIDRKLIAAADAADTSTDAERRSESERLANEDLRRAEVESGSDWGILPEELEEGDDE